MMEGKVKLTAKQQMFIKEYLIDLNATQAAIRAGYSEDTAGVIGSENLKKPYIAEAVQKAMDERANRIDTSAEGVIKDLALLRDMCMGREPVTRTVMLKSGEGDPVPVEISGKLFEPSTAKGALELLGKHHKLYTDKTEITGNTSITVLTGLPINNDKPSN
jgi:phage terminase small subunit